MDTRRVREWCSQKEKLTELKKGGKTRGKRLQGAGRKPLYEAIEEDLLEWIIDLRGRNVRVSRRMIIEKTKNYVATNDPLASFKASKGWPCLFLKRKGLSLRKKTTVSQKTPSDVIPKLVTYIMRLRKLQKAHGFDASNIVAMDETACWFDMQSDTTVDVRGARSVALKTTGHEKDHFTVILST